MEEEGSVPGRVGGGRALMEGQGVYLASRRSGHSTCVSYAGRLCVQVGLDEQ